MLKIVALVLALLSLVLAAVGVAIPHWVHLDVDTPLGTINTHAGLWRSCIEDDCSDSTVDRQLTAVRILEVVGMVLLLGAVVRMVLKLFMMKDEQILKKEAGINALCAGVLILLGCIIYVTKDSPDDTKLHAGFALCIVAAVGSFVSGILFLVIKQD